MGLDNRNNSIVDSSMKGLGAIGSLLDKIKNGGLSRFL